MIGFLGLAQLSHYYICVQAVKTLSAEQEAQMSRLSIKKPFPRSSSRIFISSQYALAAGWAWLWLWTW